MEGGRQWGSTRRPIFSSQLWPGPNSPRDCERTISPLQVSLSTPVKLSAVDTEHDSTQEPGVWGSELGLCLSSAVSYCDIWAGQSTIFVKWTVGFRWAHLERLRTRCLQSFQQVCECKVPICLLGGPQAGPDIPLS